MPEIFNTIFGRPQHDNTQSDGTDVAVAQETGGTTTLEVAPAEDAAVEATEEATAGSDAEESDDATDADEDEDRGEDETVADETDVEESEEDATDEADAEESDADEDLADDLANDVEESDEDATEAELGEDATAEDTDEDGDSAEAADGDDATDEAETDADDDADDADADDADDTDDLDEAEPLAEPVVLVPVVAEGRPAAGSRGSVSVGDGVVTKVVNIVAAKVDGVHSLDAEGTSVDVDDDVATITVSIVVEYGHAIKALAEGIRTDVIDAVEQFLGLDVAAVDVHVSDIHAPAAD